MSKIKIYDRSTIHQLSWPDTEEAKFAQQHLLPLMLEGTETFIQNAKTQLYLLKQDDLVIPISVNETEYQNCYLLSSYFAAAQFKEKIDKSSAWLKIVSAPIATLFSSLLKWMKINKVVIINNWLFSTNTYPDLTTEQVQEIIQFLTTRFPGHYYMFRSVNTYKSRQVYEALGENKFRLIPCRNVFLYDPSHTPLLSADTRRKKKKDVNRIANKNYTIESPETLTEDEILQLLHLYRNVYVNKYTQYSPIYTEKFLRHALEKKIFNIKLLKKEGQIYGVTGFLQKNGYLLVPFFGYDTTIPQEEGIYRMLSAVIHLEIEKHQLLSHQGSGAPLFKKWRGCVEQLEYVGIYDRHLPAYRRLFWSLGEKFSPFFLKASSNENTF